MAEIIQIHIGKREGRLPPNGEPPTIDGMDARIAKLEELAQDTRQRLTHIEAVLPTLSTKSEMAEMRAEMHKGFGEARADLHKMDASIKTWMLGTVVGLMVGFGGLFMALSNAVKPAAPQAAQPPIIINVPGAAAPAAPAASRP